MYQYECTTFEYLKMESGLSPVPEDSVDTYIVRAPEKGDLALVGEDIYKFATKRWVKQEAEAPEIEVRSGVWTDDELE